LGLLTAYYFIDDYTVNNPFPSGQGGATVPGFNALTLGRGQLLNIGDTKSFGGTTVNEFRLSYMRDSNNVGQPAGGVDPAWLLKASSRAWEHPASFRWRHRLKASRTSSSIPSSWARPSLI